MPAFNLKASLNRNKLPTNYDVPVFLMIRIEPTKESETAVMQLPRKVHIVFTLDTSGSMAGEKLETAKEAIIRRFNKDLSDDDLLSLITFDTNANVVVNSVSKRSAGDFESKVRSIQASGGTNLYDGLDKSIEILANTPPGYLRRIVLATDGVPTVGITDKDKIVELVRNARQNYNIQVDVYGIGADYDPALCDEIARAGGGWMRHVNLAPELEKVTQTTVLMYKATIVDKTILSINLANNVRLDDIVMASPQVQRLSNKDLMWDLGSLVAAQEIIVVAKLIVGKGFPVGINKIAEVWVGATKQDVTAEFVSDQTWMQQEDPLPRYYYVFAANIATIRDKANAGQSTAEEEGTLDQLLKSQDVQNLILRDPIFAQIVSRYNKARTIVDSRTKVDEMTKVYS